MTEGRHACQAAHPTLTEDEEELGSLKGMPVLSPAVNVFDSERLESETALRQLTGQPGMQMQEEQREKQNKTKQPTKNKTKKLPKTPQPN